MKFRNFTAVGLHGFMNFDLSFDTRINFLIGINGSGKTSVLRAITAMIGPDVDWLFSAKFNSLSLEFQIGNSVGLVTVERTDDKLIVTYSSDGDVVERSTVPQALYEQLARQEQYIHYGDEGDELLLRERSTSLPVHEGAFRLLRELPTPIYLGLDRTTLPAPGNERDFRRARASRTKRPRATLRAYLDESVAQAEGLVASALSYAQRRRASRAVKLRENILLSMFAEVAEERSRGSLPRAEDIRKYEKYRKSLKSAFAVLGIENHTVEATVDPFFSQLISIGNDLKSYASVNEIFTKKVSENVQRSFFKWITIEPRVGLISHVERLISEFNREDTETFHQIRTYTDIMNSFFRDSHKLLSVKEDGDIILDLPSGGSADLLHLSSGERQLFVLITSLMFNRDSKQADILIIDEPELSLHLKWQEMFVDSLAVANDRVQMIFATHSPSIILDREEKCIDLSSRSATSGGDRPTMKARPLHD